nr:unnamed protein product [Callosobruchus analis]
MQPILRRQKKLKFLLPFWATKIQLIKILPPLESDTKTISGEKYVTLSSVILICNGLENVYKRILTSQLDTFTNSVRNVAENITTSI